MTDDEKKAQDERRAERRRIEREEGLAAARDFRGRMDDAWREAGYPIERGQNKL